MSRKYRILQIIDHLDTGGAQEVVYNLIKYADRQRFVIELAALHGLGYYYKVIQQLSVDLYSLSPLKFSRFVSPPLLIPKILYLLREGKYHLVHCHLLASNIIAKPLAAIAGVPILFNYDHGNYFDHSPQRLYTWMDGLANRLTHHIIAVSASVRDYLIRHENVSPQKVTVIHNGIDLDHFSPEGSITNRKQMHQKWEIPQNALLVAGVGRLCYQKNFPGFLRVAAEVIQTISGVHFVIAGDGPEQKKLTQLAQELGIADRVRFLGFVKDMRQFYQAIDIFFLPSHYEGTPITMLEAMAMGVPIVASKVDGIAEILEDGVDAYLVPSGEHALFVDRLCSLLRDPAVARQFSTVAQEKVRTQHSAVHMVAQIESLYMRYLSKLNLDKKFH
jgi:glycosyltransferase involved in cell wall biosynthesis